MLASNKIILAKFIPHELAPRLLIKKKQL